ncbi:MAG: class I SAM-dependent methyltransferase [Anaerolineae bacterium]|nr:class I SAM-dependent methyltransferase [Anaerolineae bacterium]
MLSPTERFSNRVENYIKYRPSYPAALIDLLESECQLTPASLVADIGSGTGLLTKLFLDNGNTVFGVEPNAEMRAAAETLLNAYPNFVSVAAPAEATTLAAEQVDFVTAGQAFHWFDIVAALQEFRRILKPQGWIVLVWNMRRHDDPFQSAYEQLVKRHSQEYSAVNHKRINDHVLSEIMGPDMRLTTLDNEQILDYEGIKGRLLSASYAPLEGQAGHQAMLDDLLAIFEQYQQAGRVRFTYRTNVYYTQNPQLAKA